MNSSIRVGVLLNFLCAFWRTAGSAYACHQPHFSKLTEIAQCGADANRLLAANEGNGLVFSEQDVNVFPYRFHATAALPPGAKDSSVEIPSVIVNAEIYILQESPDKIDKIVLTTNQHFGKK